MSRVSAQIRALRARALATFFAPTRLKTALHRLGFVQADPIRAPARAQDLILRHRVADYRAGDLERRYQELDIEEDVFYAYGFLARPLWRVLHPRRVTGLGALERKLLQRIQRSGAIHPNALAEQFGRERVVNAWGGYSKATKQALERLHYRGLLRIVRREKGIRVYDLAEPPGAPIPPRQRYRELALAVARLLAPIPEPTLRSLLSLLRRPLPAIADHAAVIAELLREGELEHESCDRMEYLWPRSVASTEPAPPRVRFLAPFDPLVWDRRRFEHLWQWSYRFEAYTPAVRRVRGYYALPLLWRDAVIGWANARSVGQELGVEVGFVGERPRDSVFRRELDAEMERLRSFLRVPGVSRA